MCHASRHEASLERARAEGRSAAESARGEVVEPLKEEVERMRQQLEEAQAMYEVPMHIQACYMLAMTSYRLDNNCVCTSSNMLYVRCT